MKTFEFVKQIEVSNNKKNVTGEFVLPSQIKKIVEIGIVVDVIYSLKRFITSTGQDEILLPVNFSNAGRQPNFFDLNTVHNINYAILGLLNDPVFLFNFQIDNKYFSFYNNNNSGQAIIPPFNSASEYHLNDLDLIHLYNIKEDFLHVGGESYSYYSYKVEPIDPYMQSNINVENHLLKYSVKNIFFSSLNTNLYEEGIFTSFSYDYFPEKYIINLLIRYAV